MIRDAIRKMPTLHRNLRRAKEMLNDRRVAAVQRRIEAVEGHDILVLTGMRRSGNHVTINWVLDQTEGCAAFYNNIGAMAHPFTGRMKESRPGPAAPRPRLVLSYEDMTLAQALSGPLAAFLDARREMRNARVTFGVILRDPYNMFASRLKKWPERFATDAMIDGQVAQFSDLVAEAHAGTASWKGAPVEPILFNRLVTDAAYRSDLSRRLGTADGDRGLDSVPVYGHGSSFDGYEASAGHVKGAVMDRARAAKDDPAFRRIAADPVIRRLGQDVFGIEPPDV